MREYRVWAVLFFLIAINSASIAQFLDWDSDRIAYGLVSNEHHPVITSVDGILQLSCDTGDGWIVTRWSDNNGLTWGPISYFKTSGFGTRLADCSDGEYSYLAVSIPSEDTLRIYKFDAEQQLADSQSIPFGAAFDEPSICMMTDYRFAPDDPFLNLVWIEYYWSSGRIQGMYTQSRDRIDSFSDPELVFENLFGTPERSSIATTITWQGETEKVWVGACVDRLGSVGEEVILYSTTDAGENWQSVEIDSSAYSQVDVSIAGYESTLLTAYSRRVNAASQKEIFYAFSLDNGGEFAFPVRLTDSNEDDYDPKVVVCPELNSFAIFFLSSEVQQEEATLWVCEGDLTSPWLISLPIHVSEIDQALRSGGYDACATPDGFAAVWTGPGLLEGTDIWFDASWYGEATQATVEVPAALTLGAPYPNPFNSMLSVPLELSNEQQVTLVVYNALGREVMQKSFGSLTSGFHRLLLDFTEKPSGSYFIGAVGLNAQTQQVSLIK